ncbi:kinetochore-associated protein Nnf1p [Hyphopichia burtonii NRRL Y-1933]|uniref:Kinetochore-associated protein n=1 Tax=Hyphopichia burtonii NRRL Y-1933 TaxID=984485 RepID=A0A1E4RCC7_9ASCO|nr:kinetochore-associated protein Nnf1p [Hyphopichia burtonii NRRL Y-1933]ODV64929.1 kinetochore-associated protein Nnf1p [Hyphopichia burtonii NRRL Y-1933]
MSDLTRVRYERLNLVVQKALEQTINKSLNIDQMTKCFPNIAKTNDGLKNLQIARKQMRSYINDTSLKEFALIFAEQDIENKLNELDDIIQSAHHRKQSNEEIPIEIDRLSASEIIEANLIQSRQEVIRNLSMIHNQLCVDNIDLFKQLESKCAEGESIKKDIKSLIDSFTTGIDDLRQDSINDKINDLIKEVIPEEV